MYNITYERIDGIEKYYGWYLNFLTSHLEELELIDNNMTLKELEDYVHNKLKNLNQII